MSLGALGVTFIPGPPKIPEVKTFEEDILITTRLKRPSVPYYASLVALAQSVVDFDNGVPALVKDEDTGILHFVIYNPFTGDVVKDVDLGVTAPGYSIPLYFPELRKVVYYNNDTDTIWLYNEVTGEVRDLGITPTDLKNLSFSTKSLVNIGDGDSWFVVSKETTIGNNVIADNGRYAVIYDSYYQETWVEDLETGETSNHITPKYSEFERWCPPIAFFIGNKVYLVYMSGYVVVDLPSLSVEDRVNDVFRLNGHVVRYHGSPADNYTFPVVCVDGVCSGDRYLLLFLSYSDWNMTGKHAFISSDGYALVTYESGVPSTYIALIGGKSRKTYSNMHELYLCVIDSRLRYLIVTDGEYYDVLVTGVEVSGDLHLNLIGWKKPPPPTAS